MRRAISLLFVLCALAATQAAQAGSSTILPGFRSPSGNIKCLYVTGSQVILYCTIGKANYAKKLTAYCAQPRMGVDWAGFALGPRSKGAVECSGGTLYDPATQHPGYVTLAYGKTWRRGAFTCTSRTTGVTCRNPKGHGVFVSRESYRVY